MDLIYTLYIFLQASTLDGTRATLAAVTANGQTVFLARVVVAQADVATQVLE